MKDLHKPTERVSNILISISKYPNQLNFSNISKMLDIPKSTLSPILKTLTELEFIVLHSDSQKYTIGLSSFQVGQIYLENINGLSLIKRHMKSIVDTCNETCQIGINHNDEVLYITKVECSQPIKLMSSIGRNLPLYCTALGRALLFEYSELQIETLYSSGMKSFTANTIIDVKKLLETIKKSKKEGFAEERGEVTSDACCIAVPIFINKQVKVAMGVSLPIFRATNERCAQIKDLLKKHSKLIEEELFHLNIKDLF